jgi:hypothetical protein
MSESAHLDWESTLQPGPGSRPVLPSVLHVIVGHGLPGYFLNAVRSVRACAPDDQLLVIDNATPGEELRQELTRLAEADPGISLILRSVNDVDNNSKVGSLYAAYEVAFDTAIREGYDFLHLIQGDFQVLWWDSDVVRRSAEIFTAHPQCVNIQTQAQSRDKVLAKELVPAGADGPMKLRRYGLSDTGIFHVGRWRDHALRFGGAEREHAQGYLAQGLEVICHPWPTDAPIPWPPVVRSGVQRGREVPATRPYLLRPLLPEDIAGLKAGERDPWLEDVCVPWGWACASPMWVTGLDSIDYWVLRYRDARVNGIGRLLPRFDLRGVDEGDRHGPLKLYRYRPSLLRLLVTAPALAAARRIRARSQR